MLSDLQEQVARIVFALPEAAGFALAGGAAMNVQGIVNRATKDLDVFGTSPGQIDRLLPALEHALRNARLGVQRVRVGPGFAQLEIHQPARNEVTRLDLGYDFRLRTPVVGYLGPVLSQEELAADKTLALFGRAMPRDFGTSTPSRSDSAAVASSISPPKRTPVSV